MMVPGIYSAKRIQSDGQVSVRLFTPDLTALRVVGGPIGMDGAEVLLDAPTAKALGEWLIMAANEMTPDPAL